MYCINSEPPKNCLDCPLCQGEYGPGNEKSYCAVNSKVKLKYKGSRPKECPIIADGWIRKEDVINLLNRWSDGYSYIEIPTDDAIKAIMEFEGGAE